MKPKTIVGAVIAIVILVAAALVIPRIYAANESSDVAAPTLASAPADSAGGEALDVNKQWEVVEGADSYAGYRVDEVLSGENVTVVGRTNTVTGEATVEGDSLTTAAVDVDLASVATDSDRRDNYFRTIAIDTAAHPAATFTGTQPVDLAAVSTTASDITLQGELSMNGQTRSVEVPAQLVAQDGTLMIAGSIPVTWADFGVEAPSLGFVEVEKAGAIEFQVAREK